MSFEKYNGIQDTNKVNSNDVFKILASLWPINLTYCDVTGVSVTHVYIVPSYALSIMTFNANDVWQLFIFMVTE